MGHLKSKNSSSRWKYAYWFQLTKLSTKIKVKLLSCWNGSSTHPFVDEDAGVVLGFDVSHDVPLQNLFQHGGTDELVPERLDCGREEHKPSAPQPDECRQAVCVRHSQTSADRLPAGQWRRRWARRGPSAGRTAGQQASDSATYSECQRVWSAAAVTPWPGCQDLDKRRALLASQFSRFTFFIRC